MRAKPRPAALADPRLPSWQAIFRLELAARSSGAPVGDLSTLVSSTTAVASEVLTIR